MTLTNLHISEDIRKMHLMNNILHVPELAVESWRELRLLPSIRNELLVLIFNASDEYAFKAWGVLKSYPPKLQELLNIEMFGSSSIQNEVSAMLLKFQIRKPQPQFAIS